MNWCWKPFILKKKQDYINQTQGTTAIEFAMVSPVFFLIFIGIFELGSIMYIQQTLNLAILQVSRFGRTGDTMPGQTAAATASSLIAQYTFGFVTNPTLTVTPYSSFSAIPKDVQGNIIYPNNGTQNFGATNQIVLYSLSYEWKFYTPLVGTLLSPTGNGRIMLIASTILQNEPF